MSTLYLCGAGNSEGVRLALAINRHSRRWKEIYLLDDDPGKHGKTLVGVQILGPFSTLKEVDPAESEVVNLVARGTDKRTGARRKIEEYGIPFAGLVHPEVDLDGVELAPDALVYRHAVLGPESVIEDGCVVFMGAVVGHESRVGRNCVIAPHAVLNARVVLGEGVYVGCNSTILPEIQVGAEATIGVGSAVVQHVPAGVTVMGVPAEPICSKPPESGLRKPGETALPSLPRKNNGHSRTGTETEKAILSLWRRVLNKESIGLYDPFFDSGGSSLKAMEMITALQKGFNIEMSLADFFNKPTVADLARCILRTQIKQWDEDRIESALSYVEDLSDEQVNQLLSNV